ncbi:MAG: alpha-glucosidase [Cyclobacteriaceae bacterium]
MRHLLYFFLSMLFIAGCNSNESSVEVAKTVSTTADEVWWKEGVIYQLYPRSFKDSDGDGVGDLRGVIEKLDYLESLGINMVWMNPIYSSPNADNGYDISDYRDIMDEFGTMEDFDEMLKGMHARGIKFVMDVVVNHSSDEHEWFQQSRSSRDNPYRDYYHWWPAEKGTPPSRWSFFDPEGNAWKYDSLTDAYYLHYFARKQPDLNWENPEVRQEVYDIMKFWAEKGVDGFRLDAFQYVSKDTTWQEYPEGYEKEIIKYYGMGPNLHTYLREMYDEVLSKYDVFAVSEGSGSTFEDAHDLVDADRKELQMAYHFEAVGIGNNPDGYSLEELRDSFSEWDSAFSEEGWISVFLANHDNARLVSRYGNDSPEFREVSSKMLNTFLLSMRGTPYCYYGDELGMTNIDFQDISQYQDIAAINSYKKALAEGQEMDAFLENLNFTSRDNGRTPMQWNDSRNAGFTTGTPWLPVNENYTYINVADQEEDSTSCLNYFRKMVTLRNDNPVFVYGDYEVILPDHPYVYGYIRSMDDERMLVLLNFSEDIQEFQLPENILPNKIMINNYPGNLRNDNRIQLMPYQSVIYRL